MMKQCWIFVISCVIFAGLSESRNDESSIPQNPTIGTTSTKTCRISGEGESVCERMMHTQQSCGLSKSRNSDLSIPPKLLIGASSAAYQVEGAWNVSGKSENVWDRMVHTRPESVIDGSNGDVACDAYHKYEEDVQLMKSIGLQSYRFSISWSRILDPGSGNQINKAGLQYYKNLVNELVENNIQPMVTIYHWDHPHYLEDMGGWTNELMIDHFLSLARILFKELGDLVKIWQTVNEPNVFCGGAYRGESPPYLAPGKSLNSTGMYLCMHNILKAHAKAYHMYDEEFRPTQQGEVSIGNACTGFVPVDLNDTVSAETALQFDCGWVFHPVYLGDYPKIMKERIAMISKAEGREKSRLPEFSEEWIKLIKGTSDYLSLNHYTTLLVRPDPDEDLGIFNTDMGLINSFDPDWPLATASWIRDVPWGLGDLLRWIKKEYNNQPVRIMENGWADDGELDDYGRIRYYYGYMKTLLEAVKEDHCNVQSYAMWSLLDNFEWNSGYTLKFGIVGVDFKDPARTRREKLSTAWWRKVLETRKLQPVLDKP